jgi:hypothetical protein
MTHCSDIMPMGRSGQFHRIPGQNIRPMMTADTTSEKIA